MRAQRIKVDFLCSVIVILSLWGVSKTFFFIYELNFFIEIIKKKNIDNHCNSLKTKTTKFGKYIRSIRLLTRESNDRSLECFPNESGTRGKLDCDRVEPR